MNDISAFGIDHGYSSISKALSYEKQRKNNTISGGAAGTYLGAAAGAYPAAVAVDRHEEAHYQGQRAKHYGSENKRINWESRKLFDEGQTNVRHGSQFMQSQGAKQIRLAGTGFENAHHAYQLADKAKAAGKAAKVSRNKYTAAAGGAIVAGAALGSAAGHYGTRKPKKKP